MYVGIDFGTCYSSAATLSDGILTFIKESVAPYSYSWPSSVFLDTEQTWLIGHKAETCRSSDTSRYCHWFKRDFGAPTPLSIAEQWFPAERLAAEVIRAFQQSLQQNRSPLETTVFAIPADYEQDQQGKMLEAARLAGYPAAMLLAEPVAVGLYHSHLHQLDGMLDEGQFCLVYNLGGGTFNASLIRRTSISPQSSGFTCYSAPMSDRSVGGVIFDQVISRDLLQTCPAVRELIASHGQHEPNWIGRFVLADFCRSVKERLSRQEVVTDRPFPLELPQAQYSLSRERFQTLIEPLLVATCQKCADLLVSAELKPDQIQCVLLAGGSTRIPLVKTTLERVLKRPVYEAADPELAVCAGGAIHAAQSQSNIPVKVKIIGGDVMSSGNVESNDPFQKKAAQVTVFMRQWRDLRKELQGRYGSSRVKEIAEIDALSAQLEAAEKQLLYDLRCPQITFATTGTTSGGKSTLVNMLCGAEIMPSDVGEMSAGVVQIDHHPVERCLYIKQTKGALWECGDYYNQSDKQIRERLFALMMRYNEVREQENAPECPQVQLTYPTRIGMMPEVLGLGDGYRYRILDLPGLKHIADKGNSEVISRCKEALCFVTYNSTEVNEEVQRKLLAQVVANVKELGGSPVRMMFILNKIDVYRNDIGWPEGEHRFVNKISTAIDRELRQEFPEQMATISKLNILRLSSLPGLFAQIYQRPEVPGGDYDARVRSFFNLLPDDVAGPLPALPRFWTMEQRQAVGRALWQSSYADVFEEELRHHVQNNLPELIIPQARDRFQNEGGQQAVTGITQIVSAELNSSKERFEGELARIHDIRFNKLTALHEQTKSRLQAPFAKIKNSLSQQTPNLLAVLQSVLDIAKTSPYDQVGRAKLAPIYSWRDNIAKEVGGMLETIADALAAGQALDGPQFESLPPPRRRQLSDACQAVLAAGYGPIAKKGTQMRATTSSEKQQLTQMNTAMNTLADAMAPTLTDLVTRVAERESQNIFDAMQALFRCHADNLAETAHSIAPDIGLETPPLSLNRVEKPFEFGYRFAAGFDSKAVTESFLSRTDTITDQRETGKKWWQFWRPKYETYTYERPVYEKRTILDATIPSVEILLANWLQQSQECEPETLTKFGQWLNDQVALFTKNVEDFQQDLLKRYEERLKQVYEAAKERPNEDVTVWEQVQARVRELSQSLKVLVAP
jgi:molecular chaperone DnaK (HSP70)